MENYELIFLKNFKIYWSIFSFLSKGMHFLCITGFIISYKNKPLLSALGGFVEENNRQISGT